MYPREHSHSGLTVCFLVVARLSSRRPRARVGDRPRGPSIHSPPGPWGKAITRNRLSGGKRFAVSCDTGLSVFFFFSGTTMHPDFKRVRRSLLGVRHLPTLHREGSTRSLPPFGFVREDGKSRPFIFAATLHQARIIRGDGLGSGFWDGDWRRGGGGAPRLNYRDAGVLTI
jgi:hypothetical protein